MARRLALQPEQHALRVPVAGDLGDDPLAALDRLGDGRRSVAPRPRAYAIAACCCCSLARRARRAPSPVARSRPPRRSDTPSRVPTQACAALSPAPRDRRPPRGPACPRSVDDDLLAPVLGIGGGGRTRSRRRRALRATRPRLLSAVSIASSRKVSAPANSPIAIIASPKSGRSASLARCRPAERDGAAKEVRRRRHVAAGERPAPRREESGAPSGSELASVVVEGAELGEASVGLLEVVAEDLLVLDARSRSWLHASAQATKRSWRIARERLRRPR